MKSVRVSGYYCEKDMFHELHKSFRQKVVEYV